MKKNKIIPIIIVIVVIALVGGLIAFSPNLINRLLGNINSTDTETNTEVKTGVILDSDLTYKKDTTSIPLKIYNGSDDPITINAVIWRTMCSSDSCDEFNVINLDEPVTIEADSDYEYQVTDVSNFMNESAVDLGVQYVLDDKVYNLASKSIKINDFSNYTLNKNSAEDVPEEFIISKNPNNSSVDYLSDVSIKLSDSDIKMDISESLEDLNITYQIKSNILYKMKIHHPQHRYSYLPQFTVLGKPNTANITNFFNFNTISEELLISEPVTSYSDAFQFTLKGTPKTTVSSETVILGLSFYQMKLSYYPDGRPYNGVVGSSDDDYDFSSEKIPQFTLTVYDKSELATAIQNGIDKIERLSEEKASVDSVIEYARLIYDEGIAVYENREVTQTQINEVTSKINNFEIEMNPVANYTELDSTISKINALNRSYYAEGAFTEIDTQLARYEEGLSSNYQTKIDNLNTRLTNLYNSLEMLDADYTKVDSAVETAGMLTNETSDGKALYSTESWTNLQNALDAVVRGKKIDEQDIVDGYAIAITNAIANLEYAPADYTELNEFIEEYNAYKDYFVEDTIPPIEEYLKNITFDKDITEQDVVDKWYEDLNKLAENLKLKPAQGYYYSDNYELLEVYGLMPLEGYRDFFMNAQREYYTDESVEIIDFMVETFETAGDEIYGYTILEQEEFNMILMQLQTFVDMLEKKPGNYEELCNYYEMAINLNTDYYVDVTELTNALSDIDFNLKIDEQDKIDEMTQNLKDAINGLVLKDADYTEFNKAYEKAISLSSKYYVDFSAVDAAISFANTVKGLKIDRQSEVDEATDRLNDAMSKLVLKDADYSRIETLKAIINELDKSKYTNFNVVESALNDIVYGKKANEQDLVDTMYDNLRKAYDSLVKTKADYTELNAAVENAKKYESQKDSYSNYNDLQNILNSIDYNLTWDKQDVVDNYVTKINDAIKNLRKKPADYTELQEVISKIPSDYSDLDKSLQSEIESLLKEANSLSKNLTIDEQSKIDALVVKFKALIDKLPTAGNGNISDEVILSYLKVNGSNVNIKTKPFKYDVGYDVTTANIEVGLASSDSTSRIYGGKVLLPGENNVTIIVTTGDGKTYTYMLVINRSVTSDYLSELTVGQNNIDFNKTKQEYTVKVNRNTNELDLNAVAEDENAKVTIKGNENIKNGSKVYVEVESSDGSIRVYTLNVQKAGSVDVRVIIVLIMILAILSGAIKYLQEKKKNKDKNDA
jgi:hypothetical protein